MSLYALADRLTDRSVTALAALGCAVVVGIFVLVIIDVTMRGLGFTPPAFTLAVVEYLLLWFTMLAAPFLARHRGHVVIEAVVAFLPRGLARGVARCVYLGCVLVCLVFCYFSILLLDEAIRFDEIDVRGIDMPLWLLFFPMPFGFVLVAVQFGLFLFGSSSYYSYDLGEVKDGV